MKYTGERVREIRNTMKIPVKAFLGELEIQQAAFFKKEKGHIMFNLIEAYKISKMLNCTIEEIFFTN